MLIEILIIYEFSLILVKYSAKKSVKQ